MFEKIPEFKRDFIPLLNDLSIKSLYNTFKTLKVNSMVDWVRQVIYNILVTNDINKKFFDYI